MPLVRVELRNEYSLGNEDLYKGASKDDPKSILEGVTVAGLVGVLRQLGDLAEFAAQVFHDLQEQVMATTARSRKLTARVKLLEPKVQPLEKSVMAQKSRIHLAYTAGSEWHSKIRTEQNHLLNNELPSFIMNSYEECHDPPRLHLLDKFGTGGPGACLKKYSDPSYFKKALANSESTKLQENPRELRAYSSMKEEVGQSNGKTLNASSMSKRNNRMSFSFSNRFRGKSIAKKTSTSHIRSRSEPVGQSASYYCRSDSGYIECDVNSSMQLKLRGHRECSSSRLSIDSGEPVPNNHRGGATIKPTKRPVLVENCRNSSSVSWDDESLFFEEQSGGSFDIRSHVSCQENVVTELSPVTWDEKNEILGPNSQPFEDEPSGLQREYDRSRHSYAEDEIMYVGDNTQELLPRHNQIGRADATSETGKYVDALNQLESENETDSDCQTIREVELPSARSLEATIEVAEHRACLMQEFADSESEVPYIESEIGSNSSSHGSMPHKFLDSSIPEDSIKEWLPETSVSTSILGSELHERKDSPDIQRINDIESDIGDTVSDAIDPKPQSLSGHLIHNVCEPCHFKTSNNCTVEAPTVDLCKFEETSMITKTLGKSQYPLDTCSGISSVAVWTNGGLLGLQPSKPQQSRSLNSVKYSSVTAKDDQDDLSSNNCVNMPPSNGSLRELDKCSLNPQPITDTHLPAIQDFEGSSCEIGHESIQSFPTTFEQCGTLTTKLIKLYELEQKGLYQDPVVNLNDQVKKGSRVNSPSSSPPLENMKISFHPVNGLGNSQLKLKFPGGHQLNGNIHDVLFPTFQLLPEHGTSFMGIESEFESDDDTFYRSSPCMSDELMHEHSISSSEQWDYIESPGNVDQELYNVLHRGSSTQSILNDFELEGLVQGSSCNSISKGIDTEAVFNPSFSETNETCDSNPKNHQEMVDQCSIESTSSTQWYPGAEASYNLETDLPKQQLLKDKVNLDLHMCMVNKHQEMYNGCEEQCLAANDGTDIDQLEESLHEIRTTSFSLQHTVPGRPAIISDPILDISMAAVSEKANTIHQVNAQSDRGGNKENGSNA